MTSPAWAGARARILTRWPGLSADELDSTEGDREQLVGLLQVRLGYGKENAEADVDAVLADEVPMPRDVADEYTHTGSSGPVPHIPEPYEPASFAHAEDRRQPAMGGSSAEPRSVAHDGGSSGTSSGSAFRYEPEPPQAQRRQPGLIALPDSLEAPAQRMQRFVRGVFGRTPPIVERTLRGRGWLGHPLHPVLTDLVAGAWTVAWFFDLFSIFGKTSLRKGADAAILLGLAGVPLTALSGASDWQHTRGEARKIGLVHSSLNTLVAVCYLISLRKRGHGKRVSGYFWANAGFVLLNVSAYLGGELVYDLGVGTSGGRD